MPYTPKTWILNQPITDTDLNRIETGIDSAMDKIETHLADDTGWATTGITAATGWSVSEMQLRRQRGLVYLRAKFTRTGANITGIPSDGNVGDSVRSRLVQTEQSTLLPSRGIVTFSRITSSM